MQLDVWNTQLQTNTCICTHVCMSVTTNWMKIDADDALERLACQLAVCVARNVQACSYVCICAHQHTHTFIYSQINICALGIRRHSGQWITLHKWNAQTEIRNHFCLHTLQIGDCILYKLLFRKLLWTHNFNRIHIHTHTCIWVA